LPAGTNVWVISPIPSIRETRVSPGWMNRFGDRPTPTLQGVPVKMMSPGSRVTVAERPSIRAGTEKDQFAGAALLDFFTVEAAPKFQIVRVRELIRRDQPRPDRPEAGEGLSQPELRGRAAELGDTLGNVLTNRKPSNVIPSLGRGTSFASLPITATSSTSQSVFHAFGNTTIVSGPVMQVWNFVNTGGRLLGLGETRLLRVIRVVQTDRENLPRGRRRRPQQRTICTTTSVLNVRQSRGPGP
jgi:hypothetical protein